MNFTNPQREIQVSGRRKTKTNKFTSNQNHDQVTGSSSLIGLRVLKPNGYREERTSESLCPAAQRDESSTTSVPLVYKDGVNFLLGYQHQILSYDQDSPKIIPPLSNCIPTGGIVCSDHEVN